MTKFIYYAAVCICTLSFSQNNSVTNQKIAMAYMNAYGKWDFETMKTFYSDDIHFEDPTAKEVFDQKFEFHGKDSVLNFFKSVFKDRFKNNRPPYIGFIIGKNFASGSHVVINSTFECVLPSSWFKAIDSETVLISIPFLTILTIEDGLIKQHLDYADYTTYFNQINAQIKK